MNTLTLRSLARIHWLLPGLLLLAAAWLGKLQPPVAAQLTAVKPPFTVRSYGGKCLEYGVPRTPREEVLKWNYPVFIADCKGTAVQQIRVEELTDRPGRLVILRAGNRVIGKRVEFPVFTLQSTAAEAESEASAAEPPSFDAANSAASTPDQTPLEAQPYTGGLGQIFALDGDSIILNADRNLVVEVKNNRGANGTPLVLGRRDLADAEFWDFIAADGSAQRPTSGFVRISQNDNLPDGGGELRARADFLHAIFSAKWGTVIELDPNVSLNLADTPPLPILAGVTIRGDRRGTRPGPLLQALNQEKQGEPGMLFINGDHVRITGLRMQGPSRIINDYARLKAHGIMAPDLFISIIDHNEMFDWPASAVHVFDAGIPNNRDLHTRPQNAPNVRVARNFIHHTPSGYGVVTSASYPSIEGNTFITNRHAIAASNQQFSAYRAWFNLILSAAPGDESAFDAHGTGDNGFGGTAGHYFEIAYNTFLGMNRENFELRGEPGYLAEFHHNVSRLYHDKITGEARRLAVKCSSCGDANKLKVSGTNQFGAPNPTNRLGVGDFDGDGKDDLFLATGAAWYYAPAGQAEWRYLNAQTDKLDTLLFGDFDADGRTDVFTQHDGSRWDVSWGGASRWEMINGSGPILGKAAIGDFDGDRRADVFYADQGEWQVSFGGTGFFMHYALAAHRVPDLRFGDFNNDGKTDVFGVVGNQWMVVYGGTQFWSPLRTKLSDSVTGLTVADFDGDGRADVTRSISLLGLWQVSWGGVSGWTSLRADKRALSSMPALGRFDGAPGADVLTWAYQGSVFSGFNSFDIASGGAEAFQDHSRQDMR